jgi:hypothetical protein
MMRCLAPSPPPWHRGHDDRADTGDVRIATMVHAVAATLDGDVAPAG